MLVSVEVVVGKQKSVNLRSKRNSFSANETKANLKAGDTEMGDCHTNIGQALIHQKRKLRPL
jgi:hypothetical protein